MHSGKPAVSAVLLALLCLTLFSLAGCASSQSPQGPVPARQPFRSRRQVTLPLFLWK